MPLAPRCKRSDGNHTVELTRLCGHPKGRAWLASRRLRHVHLHPNLYLVAQSVLLRVFTDKAIRRNFRQRSTIRCQRHVDPPTWPKNVTRILNFPFQGKRKPRLRLLAVKPGQRVRGHPEGSFCCTTTRPG